jgi:NAD(P)-dependent dehydrogenase (short-subunit alcohol dehydrogenase family)
VTNPSIGDYSNPSDHVAIITGGAQGLGRAMTLSLLRNGLRVTVADLPSSNSQIAELKNIAARASLLDRLCVVEGDVTEFSDCERIVDATLARFGSIHGLVNNAAIGMQDFGNVLVGRRKPFYELDASSWQRAIDVNVNGPFMMAKAVAPVLVAQRWGRIVNIETSMFTMLMDGFSPYGPSKAALEAATVIWAKDLAGTGVTVNALLPGGAANTRMIPEGEPVDRSALVQPEAMMEPIAWLMSPRSNGANARRINASEWEKEKGKPAADIGLPAGWSI